MRNIGSNVEFRYIRVVDFDKKTKDGSVYEVMKIVTIGEIEKKYEELEAKYSRI